MTRDSTHHAVPPAGVAPRAAAGERPRWIRGGWLLVGLCLAPRLAALWLWSESLGVDRDGYQAVADSLLTHGVLGFDGQPSAIRPPLYPLLLAAVRGLAAAGTSGSGPLATGCLQLVLGAATIWLVFRLARGDAFGLGPAAPWAALLVAWDPLLVSLSTQVMTETLAALLTVVALAALVWAADRPALWRWAATGAVLGLCILCRPTYLAWAALVAAAIPATQRTRRRWAPALAGLALGAAAILSPWLVRNWLAFRQPIVTTTHGGYTLLLANNPRFYAFLRAPAGGATWDAGEFERDFIDRWRRQAAAPVKDLAYDRFAYAEAWRHMTEQPAMALRSCAFRLRRFWGLWPLGAAERPQPAARSLFTLAGWWYAAEFGLSAVGLWSLGRRLAAPPWLWGLLLVAAFSLVHAFYWTDLRMRAPVMPVVALTAAAGGAWLAGPARRSQVSRMKPVNRTQRGSKLP